MISEDVLFFITENKLTSSKKSIFKDNNSNLYTTDKFDYSMNEGAKR